MRTRGFLTLKSVATGGVFPGRCASRGSGALLIRGLAAGHGSRICGASLACRTACGTRARYALVPIPRVCTAPAVSIICGPSSRLSENPGATIGTAPSERAKGANSKHGSSRVPPSQSSCGLLRTEKRKNPRRKAERSVRRLASGDLLRVSKFRVSKTCFRFPRRASMNPQNRISVSRRNRTHSDVRISDWIGTRSTRGTW
jgi:hypothetical protein